MNLNQVYVLCTSQYKNSNILVESFIKKPYKVELAIIFRIFLINEDHMRKILFSLLTSGNQSF